VSAVGWLGVFAFVVAVLVSVVLHEAGHFIAARRFGMKATEFFVGFGPKVWSFRRGETEYGLKAIPAGGYVKIIGMTDLEPVAEEDQARAFYRQSATKRAVVLSAGSFMHLVIGFVLLVCAYWITGVSVPTTSLASVSTCVPTSATQTACAKADPKSPAEQAGLRPGDAIVAVNGRPVTSSNTLVTDIRESAGKPTDLTVRRDGQSLAVTVVPTKVSRPDLNDPNKIDQVGAIGVSFATAQQRSSLVGSVRQAGSGVVNTLTASVKALVSLPQKVGQLISTLTSDAPRDPNGLVGIYGATDIAGQVASSNIPVAERVSELLMLVAGFNIFVGLFNMLPLLPLDGGHVAVLAYERARAWAARRRGRPEPARPDMNKLLPLAYGVFILFIGLTVLLLTADIIKPVHL
jgi:membrane-associated protease RseP (regulator of RpoE activity)